MTRLFVFILLSLLLVSCGGGGGTAGITALTAIATTDAPEAPDPALILADTSITINFSESMDTTTGTWHLDGDMASESDGGTWSLTNVQNDTLTIRPATSWAVKLNRKLIIDAHDLAGNKLNTLNLVYNLYQNTRYYVDANRPDDNGDGLSPATARKYIYTAVADALPPATVLVRAGEYHVRDDLDTEVRLKEAVSLYGGYAKDFGSRDPGNYTTIIEDYSTSSAKHDAPWAAIVGNSAISSNTIVDGFTIHGSTRGADYTTAILLANNAAPTISNNNLAGGNRGNDIGIYIDHSSPMVLNNNITGGTTDGISTGMYNIDSSPIAQNNRITGESGGAISRGMFNLRSSPKVLNNIIYSGNASHESTGVFNQESSPSIENNRITSGDTDRVSTGISNNSRSSPLVRNNTIYAGQGLVLSYGLWNADNSSPIVMGNIIYGGSSREISSGIYNFDYSSPTIQNNIINGGISDRSSTGIRNAFGSSPVVQNNIIYAGGNVTSSAVAIRNVADAAKANIDPQPSSPIVQNNILMTSTSSGSICLTASSPYATPFTGPRIVQNNDFYGCLTIYFDTNGGCGGNASYTCTLEEMETMTSIPGGASGNVSDDPLFDDFDGPDDDINTMDDNNWRFTATSPISVTSGGLNGADQMPPWSFRDDLKGTLRAPTGMPWSIGAYEP